MFARHNNFNLRESIVVWLFLLIGIFCATNASLFVLSSAENTCGRHYDLWIERQRNRRDIGNIIQKELLLIGYHAHNLTAAADVHEVNVIQRKIAKETGVIENSLLALNKAGVFREESPANRAGVDEMQKRINFPPDIEENSAEVVGLTPMVHDLLSGTDELSRFVKERFSAPAEEKADLDKAVSLRLHRVYATINRFRKQGDENNYNTARRLVDLESQREKSNLRVQTTIHSTIVGSSLLGALVGGLILLRISRNLAEGDKTAAELSKSKETTQHILQKLPLGVIVVGQEKIINYVNDAAVEMAGYQSADELVGKQCHETFCPAEADSCPILQLGQTLDNSERVLITRNKKQVPILKTVIPVTLDGKKVLLETFLNLSEQKKSEHALRDYAKTLETTNRALEESRCAVEKANQEKSEFLANISHELRTPLHGILSFASFGQKKVKTSNPDKLLEYFERIDNSGQTLLHLVNDLMDLSKLEAGKMTLDIIALDLGLLINQIINEFSSRVAKQSITIVCEKLHFDTQIMADQTRMEQVLRNLMSNAVKFSPDGSTIEVKMERNDDTITVSVLDQGVGIPQGELESIFDRFIQSSITRTGAGGTGLGLAICREIVEFHKGRIWAENRPGGGAVLSFEIPVNIDAADTSSSPASEKECMSGCD